MLNPDQKLGESHQRMKLNDNTGVINLEKLSAKSKLPTLLRTSAVWPQQTSFIRSFLANILLVPDYNVNPFLPCQGSSFIILSLLLPSHPFQVCPDAHSKGISLPARYSSNVRTLWQVLPASLIPSFAQEATGGINSYQEAFCCWLKPRSQRLHMTHSR